jgi:transcriptional antiterminator RfaH
MITWYVAYTQPNGEMRALEHLERQDYATYLPRYRRMVRHARRRTLMLRPLFPRYLFVGLDRQTQRWRPICSTCGIVTLVTKGNEPALVDAAIIEGLQRRENEGAFDLPSPVRRLSAGDAVRVTDGPFADLVGRLLGATDGERVFILLDLLGRTVRAELPILAVEAA